MYDSELPSLTMYVGGKDLWLNYIGIFTSRHAEKYVRKGRLDWPEGAASRESIKAVLKLPRLQVRSRYSLICRMPFLVDIGLQE